MSFRRDKAILVAGLISDRVGLVLLFVVFGPMARALGLSEIQFGTLIASANITLAWASPYWGRRSQGIGRRPVFVIGLTGYALGFLLLALVLQAGTTGWLGHWPLFFALLAVRVGYGLFAAGTQPAATAYLADISDAHDRSRAMALIGVAAGIGTVVGPVVGGGLTALGAVVPLYVAAGLAAVAALLAYAGLREPGRREVPAPGASVRFTDRRILACLVGWCLAVFVLTSVQTVTAFLVADRFALADSTQVTRAASAAFLAMGGAMLVAQGVVLQVFRISGTRLLRVGFGLFALALLGMLVARNVPMLCAAYGLMGLGFSAVGTGLNTAATTRVTSGEQGGVAGLLAAAPVLGMIAGPVAGTALYTVDPALPLVLGAAGCAAMAICFAAER